MGKKVKAFKAGDFIFAKVKGYPAWPARVQGITGKKYFVFFYGTREIANLPPNMIFDYAENKDKFLSKSVKRKDFNDGVKQIEHDFANNVPLEDVVGTVPASEKANASLNDTDLNETVDDTLNATADDTGVGDQTADFDESTSAEMSIDKTTEESDDAGTLVIDEGKVKSAKKKTAAKEVAKTPKTPRTGRSSRRETLEEVKEDEKKDEEVVSRSGRKIKPKRYIDEETDESSVPSPAPKKRKGASPEKFKATESVSTPDASDDKKVYNTVHESDIADLQEPFKSDKTDNLLIARLPSGQFVGVKLFQERPVSFKSETEKLAWEKKSAKNSILLKHDLEEGLTTPLSVLSQIEMDLKLTDEEKAKLEKGQEYDETKSRVRFLKVEVNMIDLEAKIKNCLSLERADTELCLKLIDELLTLELKPLMFLKHPSTMDTIKRMRYYVGNTPSWDLTEEEAVHFSKQADLIRKKAMCAYSVFKALFRCPQGASFLDMFNKQLEEFKKCTSGLTSNDLLQLVKMPEEMLNLIHKTRKSTGGDEIPNKKKKPSPGKNKNEERTSQKNKSISEDVTMIEKDTEEVNEKVAENDNTKSVDANNTLSMDIDVNENDTDKTDTPVENSVTEINDKQEESKDTESTSKNKDVEDDTVKDVNKDTSNKDEESNDQGELDKSPVKQKENEDNEESTKSQEPGKEKDSTEKQREEENKDDEESSNQKEHSKDDTEPTKNEKESNKDDNESTKNEKESSKETESTKTRNEPSEELESTKESKEKEKESSTESEKEASKRASSRNKSLTPTKSDKETKIQKDKNERTPTKRKSPRRSFERESKKDEKDDNANEPGKERESSVEPKSRRNRESSKKPEATPPQARTPNKRKAR